MAVSSSTETYGDTFIDPQTIDPEKAEACLTDALAVASKNLRQEGHLFNVVFNSQPTEKSGAPFNPMAPIDLKLNYDDGCEVKIDMVNVVGFPAYDPQVGRLTDGLKSVEAFATEIMNKVEEHLATEKDSGILISKAGSKYSTAKLTVSTLSIDPQDYLRVNGYRIRAHGKDDWILSASSLRGHHVMVFKEEDECLYLEDEGDPAPHFYILLSDFVSFATPEAISRLPEKNQADAEDYLTSDKKGIYLRLSREPGKI